jgi:BirA family biotin operon repressor/biotin-[acetyl-CoA-carboxylase] ligase
VTASFDAVRFRELADERGLKLGTPLVAVDVTGSTNDDAMAAVRAGAVHGATFVADAQTAGRGRRGARWSSPPGENLLLSIVLRPKLAPERAGALTLAIGLAVRDIAASRVESPVLVKWPNDVLSRGEKLAGILLESQVAGGVLESVIAGIGLNVSMREMPPEIAALATSLALLGATGPDLERERIVVDLLEAIDQRVTQYECGGLSELLPDLRRYDALDGRRVRAGTIEGASAGISDQGALLVRDQTGALHSITSGPVESL